MTWDALHIFSINWARLGKYIQIRTAAHGGVEC